MKKLDTFVIPLCASSICDLNRATWIIILFGAKNRRKNNEYKLINKANVLQLTIGDIYLPDHESISERRMLGPKFCLKLISTNRIK